MTDYVLSPPKKANEKYSYEQVVDAVVQAKGLTTVAARILKCSPDTVRRYQREYASVAAAFTEQRASVTDMAEAALFKAINEGQAWAVCFYLKTQGRDRGYIERHQIEVITPEQAAKLSDAEIDALLQKEGLL
jgi:hypothetical protein